jgi:hypothetical protein
VGELGESYMHIQSVIILSSLNYLKFHSPAATTSGAERSKNLQDFISLTVSDVVLGGAD